MINSCSSDKELYEIYEKGHSKYSDQEYTIRCKLAAAYRLMAYFKWDELIYNHLTARIPGTEHILLNPFGMRFDEITASSLVCVDLDGKVVDPGNTTHGFNYTGYVIHGAIHKSRPDVLATVHTHSPPGVAVASYKDGLLLTNQTACTLGEVTYHDYEGISTDKDEQERIIKSLGDTSNVLILRNHGLLTCGDDVAAAFARIFTLTKACEIQVQTLSMVGGDQSKITPISQEIQDKVANTHKMFSRVGYGKKEFKAFYNLMLQLDPSFKN
ncbi:hypothetical protein CYY_004943 [Polysphondylium violaceum]|uniref:Class II aldolase/adducin N-terminal domain-containing protein n=1 Tax=Polysphondylium violaceum TaxID=133409 RepID=A0A8J4USK8_9MYCE|nr:hypothetical protein CYY_004943 [Polysphondylium violaceum]